ncbi:MarR family winged helix-turn-helix transcriptional regulator [Photobacterium kishitanii]|uniref:MarR family winged helix-turn-helix transcriptional regulator n=1 Tax=Photobacterium kishitanii TaxID=318456 RepID=UPI0004327880|nr:MarR family winged helix-turn-helix transcriptional regulator [Photobacterium kishitanii]CEO41078.1 putative Transcriptional regulator, MarR family protein [Photobacterium kishitanii]
MNIIIIQQLLDRIGNLIRVEMRTGLIEHGLQPVQFDALYYLSICNRFSNTPKAVTEFLGLTKGTVSQTIKVLETKGYIEKVADCADKRVMHLIMTVKGRQLLDDYFPSAKLLSACSGLEGENSEFDPELLQQQLILLLASMQKQHQYRSFGVCSTCQHHLHVNNGYVCGLTQLPLTSDDITLICVEHQRRTKEK